MKPQNLKKISVDSITVRSINSRKGIVELLLKGTLPNPAYKLDHIQTDVEKDEINITPWASYDPNLIVIQMIVNFEEKCTVKGLKKGKQYSIKVNGIKKVLSHDLQL